MVRSRRSGRCHSPPAHVILRATTNLQSAWICNLRISAWPSGKLWLLVTCLVMGPGQICASCMSRSGVGHLEVRGNRRHLRERSGQPPSQQRFSTHQNVFHVRQAPKAMWHRPRLWMKRLARRGCLEGLLVCSLSEARGHPHQLIRMHSSIALDTEDGTVVQG
jgi:hypothetical protein